MTRERINAKGEGMSFSDVAEVRRAYEAKEVELHTKITVRVNLFEKDEAGELMPIIKRVETTVGRSIVSEILPKGLGFENVDINLTKKNISRLINMCYRTLGLKETVIFADQLMYMGFRYATLAGVSIGVEGCGSARDRQPIRIGFGNTR